MSDLEPEEQREQPVLPKLRRLDELSWLLEGQSICVAVVYLNERFYIAGNEFFKGTRAYNKQKKFIEEIYKHFKKIANGTSSYEIMQNRDVLIREICKKRIEAMSRGRIKISDPILEQSVSSSNIANAIAPEISTEIERDDMVSACLAYGVAVNVYNRMKKIEDSILNATKGDFTDFTAEQLKAFQTDATILQIEDSQGVHAELQILDLIVEKINNGKIFPSKVYVGISKRCCLNCECMVVAANKKLKDLNIELIVEGAHGALFEENWVEPLCLSHTDGIMKNVREIYEEELERHTPVTDDYDLEHPQSGSEGKPDPEAIRAANLYSLQDEYEAYEKIQEKIDEIGFEQHYYMVEMGIWLHNNIEEGFSHFFTITSKTLDTEINLLVIGFLKELDGKKFDFLKDSQILLNFFKSKHFDVQQIEVVQKDKIFNMMSDLIGKILKAKAEKRKRDENKDGIDSESELSKPKKVKGDKIVAQQQVAGAAFTTQFDGQIASSNIEIQQVQHGTISASKSKTKTLKK